jgi:hypothetical protein
MITINKSVNDWTCGFEESYSVCEIELTFDQDLINQISLAWEYLKDKINQSIRIISNKEEVQYTLNQMTKNLMKMSIQCSFECIRIEQLL